MPARSYLIRLCAIAALGCLAAPALAQIHAPYNDPYRYYGSCSWRTLDRCERGYSLRRISGFEIEVRRFLGDEEGVRYPLASEDALMVLEVPKGDPAAVDGGLKLHTSCDYSACENMGAMILRPDGDIAAIGILMRRHGPNAFRAGGEQTSRIPDYYLSVYVDKTVPLQQHVTTLTSWARKHVAEQPAMADGKKLSLAPIERIHVRNPANY